MMKMRSGVCSGTDSISCVHRYSRNSLWPESKHKINSTVSSLCVNKGSKKWQRVITKASVVKFEKQNVFQRAAATYLV